MYIRLLVIIILTAGIYFLNFPLSEIIFSTLFTVASIFVSIALTLITTFNFDKIKNLEIYKNIRKNLYRLRNSYLRSFLLLIFVYLLGLYFNRTEQLGNLISSITLLKDYSPVLEVYNTIVSKFVTSLALATMLVSICYFIINFLEIQKLKDDINEQARRNS